MFQMFPYLQQLISLSLRSRQNEIQKTQEDIDDRITRSHDFLAEVSTDQSLKLTRISERLDTSQARIEAQLETLLASQPTSKTLLSQSLNASSPEGRQTWMELGRLLRDEGITPAMVQENRGLLINAMKNTLRNVNVLAESIPLSYVTAPEYDSKHNSPLIGSPLRNVSLPEQSLVQDSISILGSAPPSNTGFMSKFLQREIDAASSLDQKQNVNDGIESLIQGMSCENNDSEEVTSDESDSGDVSFDEDPEN